MKMLSLKILTLLIWFTNAVPATFAQESDKTVDQTSVSKPAIVQENLKTHLRWNIYAPKGSIVIDKEANSILIKSLDQNLFQKVKSELIDKEAYNPNKYIKAVTYLPMSKDRATDSLLVEFTSDKVELFSFYKESDEKMIMDFWKEEDTSKSDKITFDKPKNAQEIETAKPIPEAQKVKPTITKNKRQKIDLSSGVSDKKVERPKNFSSDEFLDKDKSFRDFRYGTPIVWDYLPLDPDVKKAILLQDKTPEYFYKVADRPLPHDEQEAHLQLAINLYRRKKYGLMYKSLKLFEQKYPENKQYDVVEYLKANAMLREALEKGEKAPLKIVSNMLLAIAGKSKNYEMRRAIYKYLITYYEDSKDFVHTLQIAKKFYVACKENFDYEEATSAASAMVYGLAGLRQLDTIVEITQDKTIQKILSKQVLLGYQMYVQLMRNQVQDVTRTYEINKKSLASPVHELILFNAAEAYFRQAKYEEAIALFDQFIAEHSYHTRAADARLRLALSFDLLDKDEEEVAQLYLNTINRSQDFDISFEAKLRYVSLLNVRKKDPNAQDKEKRIFLNLDEEKEKIISKNNLKLLWLTRLRLFIVDHKYHEALSYLTAIPLSKLPLQDVSLFEADGAEIIYGLILKEYMANNFSKAVKIWEVYQSKYIDKVANDPYLNFIIGQSYAKLGLYKGFERLYSTFDRIKESPPKTYPLWVERKIKISAQESLTELDIIKNIKLENWDLAKRAVDKYATMNPQHGRVDYYKGIIDYKNKEYKEAAKNFENYLSKQKEATTYDISDVADLLLYYTDSIYQLGDLERYKKISQAILGDTKNYVPDNQFIQKVRERISYLSIEILASEANKKSQLLVESRIKKFFEEFKEGQYKDRLTYLLGVALLNNQKTDEGKKILGDLINSKDAPGHIKELAKTELSLMSIKEKTI